MATSLLQRALSTRLDDRGRTWLEGALAQPEEAKLVAAFAVAPRKLGAVAVALSPSDLADARDLGWLSSTSTDELARVLLLSAAARASDTPVAVAAEWYRQGDNAEKRAVLRALSLLPSPEACVEIAINACRSSVQSVFEGICCDNPYPAAFFPELAFNQMVLKALFTGVAIERIHSLETRRNAELARMAEGYASERRAAGRSVPTDIGRVL